MFNELGQCLPFAFAEGRARNGSAPTFFGFVRQLLHLGFAHRRGIEAQAVIVLFQGVARIGNDRIAANTLYRFSVNWFGLAKCPIKEIAVIFLTV